MTIKLICFDLDGVLVDAKDLHYEALNRALATCAGTEFVISREDHESRYDGLPTRLKLEMLTSERGLDERLHDVVSGMKQKLTLRIIRETVHPNPRIKRIIQALKQRFDVNVVVASNAVPGTVFSMLRCADLFDAMDTTFSNEDVILSKPSPHIYWKCMLWAGANPSETLVIEDSAVGRTAAIASGAHLLGVESSKDVTLERISRKIDECNEPPKTQTHVPKAPWIDADHTTVVIPMAGEGSRFRDAGYTFPKPLVEVFGKPMIQVVVENLGILAKHVFIVQKSHREKYNLDYLLRLISPGCQIVEVDGVTQGAACTVLLSESVVDPEDHLVIANSDQVVGWEPDEFCYRMISTGADGGILTFRATHPKWSFVRLNKHGLVVEVAEKRPISDIATTGIYYWRRAASFFNCARQMIEDDIRVNGEFYVAPVFNDLIGLGGKVLAHPARTMHGIGTPEDLARYVQERSGQR